MSLFEALVLGFIQGFTEFLPISSSGVLIFTPYIFGWEQQPLDFDVIVHIGSLIAIILAFSQEIKNGLFSRTLLTQIAIGTLPVVLAVLILPNDFILGFRTLPIIAFSLIFWGLILWFSDLYQQRNQHKISLDQISWKHSIFIGLSQIIALIPGSSRSGTTMTAGLFAGLNREDTAKFSFLLAIPALIGAGLFTGLDAYQAGWQTNTPALIAGFIASMITSLLTIKLLLHLIKKMGYGIFAFIRIIFALIIIFFLI